MKPESGAPNSEAEYRNPESEDMDTAMIHPRCFTVIFKIFNDRQKSQFQSASIKASN